MRKIFPVILSLLLLLCCLGGCKSEPQTADPNAVLQHLLSDIQYDAPLNDAGAIGSIYFPNLPQGTSVQLFICSSGYYPDEVVMITAGASSDMAAIKAAVDSHVSQVRNQFQSYIPEELVTIDNAVVKEIGNTLFLVITSDHAAVNKLFENAHTLTYQPTTPADTTQTTGNTENSGESTDETEENTGETGENTGETEGNEETKEPVIVGTIDFTNRYTAEGYPILESSTGTYSYYKNGVMRVEYAAFEPYSYNTAVADSYADIISKTADALAGKTKVYCLPIPTAIGVVLPDNIIEQLPRYRDQGEDIEDIFSKMSKNVIGVNCFHDLMLHRNEYLYFRTDYHWNGPAGYYAYETFCAKKGIAPYTRGQRREWHFDNYIGYLYSVSSEQDPALLTKPDTVIAYLPYSPKATMFYITDAGKRVDCTIISDVSSTGSGNKYLCYAGADQPYAEFHNPDVTDDSVLIVVKESYGNVLMSYLVDHYSVIYEIDYRYWKGDLIQFAKEVGADDILFANNMAMINSGYSVGQLGVIVPDPAPEENPPENEPPVSEPPVSVPPENDPPENDPPENDPPENDPPENETPENDLQENDPSENKTPENDLPAQGNE